MHHIFKPVNLFILLLGGFIIYLLFFDNVDKDIYKQVGRLQSENDNLYQMLRDSRARVFDLAAERDSLEAHVDTVEIIRERWVTVIDTNYVDSTAQDPETDSTLAATLTAYRELTRANELQITNLQAINIKNQEIIGELEGQLNGSLALVALKEEHIELLRADNKKLRVQNKILLVSGIVATILGMVLI